MEPFHSQSLSLFRVYMYFCIRITLVFKNLNATLSIKFMHISYFGQSNYCNNRLT